MNDVQYMSSSDRKCVSIYFLPVSCVGVWTKIALSLLWLRVERLKVRLRVIPVHAVKAYKRMRGVTPLILNLDTRWLWVVKLKLRPLYPRGRTPVPMEYMGPRTGVDWFREGEQLLPLLGYDWCSILGDGIIFATTLATEDSTALGKLAEDWSQHLINNAGCLASRAQALLLRTSSRKKRSLNLGWDTDYSGRDFRSFTQLLQAVA